MNMTLNKKSKTFSILFLFGMIFSIGLVNQSSFIESAYSASMDFNPAKDTSIHEGFTGNGNGASDCIYTGQTGSNAGNTVIRSLVQFDLSSISPGTIVTDATLDVDIFGAGGGGPSTPVTLHRLTSDWGEGTSNGGCFGGGDGAGASAGDATWVNAFHPGTAWSSAGGDFNATASATTSIAGGGNPSWNSADLTRDVQFWIDNPSSNFGWIIIGDEGTSQSTKKISSKSSGDPPNLNVMTQDAPAGNGTITVIKMVINNFNGTAVPGDFQMQINGTNVPQNTQINATEGFDYVITEVGIPAGYQFLNFTGDCDSMGVISGIMTGQNKTCTVFNEDIAPTITLIKNVTNNFGGTAVPGDFQLQLDGQNATQNTPIPVNAGTNHTISEIGIPAGYEFVSFTGDCDASGEIANINLDEHLTCTVTNQDQDPGSTCNPPANGTWTQTTDCTLGGNETINGNVEITSGAVVTIPSPFSLTIDFTMFSLSVESGSGLQIQAGASIN